MAQSGNDIKEILKAIERTTCWFHNIHVNVAPDGNGTVNRTISLGVQIIVILIILIMLQRFCPNLLRSLKNLIVEICEAIIPILRQAPIKSELL
jgi:hypothetical protein